MALLGTGSGLAGQAPAQPGSVPDISGYWLLDNSGMRGPRVSPPDLPEGWRNFGMPDRPGPMLRPEIYAALKAQRVKEAAAREMKDGLDPQTAACEAGGFPDFISFGEPLDIHQRADEIVMVTERERQLPRHVYILPDHPLDPTYAPAQNGLTFRQGHSLGRWERGKLIVETDAFMEGPWMFSIERVPHSDAMTTHEVYELSADGKVLTDTLTITDPKTLVQPWVLKFRWNRAPKATEAFEGECHVDLDFLNAQPH
jgi:hypothetical protein